MSMAGDKAVARYNKYGKKLVMGDDISTSCGPDWLLKSLAFSDNADSMIIKPGKKDSHHALCK